MTELNFNLPAEQSSIIKVVGVGGGGGNAVNHMFEKGITGVNFVICNTDAQALDSSPVPNKIQLGPEITHGLGAGNDPEIGRLATEESEPEIRELLSKNTKMVFITAGMGGGTGTGAAPVVARIARDLNLLVVGIVTTPFSLEGPQRIRYANDGIQRMREYVDAILVISNDKLREMYGKMKVREAFSMADDILATAAKSISEIITIPGMVNVDFADVVHVMKNSGVSIMGSGEAEGEDRAARAAEMALNSPLLADNDIRGAEKVLLNITTGLDEISLDEMEEIIDIIRSATGTDTNLIYGTVHNDEVGDKVSVTLIATGFNKKKSFEPQVQKVQLNGQENKQEKNHQTTELNFPLTEIKPEKEELKFEIKDLNQKQEPELYKWEPEAEKIEKKEPETLDFEVKNIGEEKEEPKAVAKDLNEQIREERLKRMNDMSYKFKSESNISELESTPAYLRRNIELNETPYSDEDQNSRYSVKNYEDEGENKPEIRKNNSFLHDNVD